MSDGDRWREIDGIFDEALGVEPEERQVFVRERCGNDSELQSAVDRLLVLEAEAEGFLEIPVVNLGRVMESTEPDPAVPDAAEPDPYLGTRIGPYRLLDVLGRGGMGRVYHARREEGYRQDVAIKLLLPALAGASMHRRIRQERQILARLEHPGIARLYDGGTTPAGLPYLVMERVEGLPIDRYADHHRLDVDQRLELLREVCAIVDYAHGKHLVHCDLKPSNILVTVEGTPKLLDFGIAKLLRSEPEEDEPTLTRDSLRPMTLAYASPEQVRGEPITVASDVYSLGVLLFRLLSGRLPVRPVAWDGEALPASEAPSRRLRSEDADGAAEIATTRGTTPRALARRLRGDLDTIVRRALAPDPGDRYPSVAALALDLARNRAGEPLVVERGQRLRRFGRWLRRLVLPPDAGRRRERLFWVFSLPLLAILGIALGPLDWPAAHSVDSIEVVPRAIGPVVDLADGASAAESHLAESRRARQRSDYRLQRNAAVRARLVAQTAGEPAHRAEALLLEAEALEILGQPVAADRALAEARRLFDQLGDRHGIARSSLVLRFVSDRGRLPLPLDRAIEVFVEVGDRRGEALSRIRNAKVGHPERFEWAEGELRQGLDLAGDDPAIQAEAWSNLASIQFGRENLAAARDGFDRAVELARRSGDQALLCAYLLNASFVHRELGDVVRYDALVEESLAISRRIGYRQVQVAALGSLAGSREVAGTPRALELRLEAFRIANELGDHRSLEGALNALARERMRRREPELALELWERLREIYVERGGREESARIELEVSRCLWQIGRVEEGEARLRAVAAEFGLDDPTYEFTALQTRVFLVELLISQRRTDEALALLRAILPTVLVREETVIRRATIALAAEAEEAEGALGSATAATLHTQLGSARTTGDLESELLLEVDLARWQWFTGREGEAEARLDRVADRASEQSLDWIAVLAGSEVETLDRPLHLVFDY